MAADAWKMYHRAKEFLGDGTLDLDADTLKMALFLSTSNAATLTNTIDEYGDLTNEHANGNGYTTGGVTLASVTWVESAGVITLDSADAVWTASGGSIVARFAVVYANVTRTIVDPLICMSLLDNTPADVTVTDGNTLTVSINASGILTLSGGS